MKRILILLPALILFASLVNAGTHEMRQQAGKYEIVVETAGPSLAVSDNPVSIRANDAHGKPVTDAAVELYYFMPSMPAMNATVKAEPKGTAYDASIKPTMAGEWQVVVKVRDRDGRENEALFSYQAM